MYCMCQRWTSSSRCARDAFRGSMQRGHRQTTDSRGWKPVRYTAVLVEAAEGGRCMSRMEELLYMVWMGAVVADGLFAWLGCFLNRCCAHLACGEGCGRVSAFHCA
eukprot:jgi/Ulvmu1/9729/UM055_0069.1